MHGERECRWEGVYVWGWEEGRLGDVGVVAMMVDG